MSTDTSPIIVGLAIVPWAPETRPFGKDPLPAGWALPGGARETELARALEVANLMDRIMRGEVWGRAIARG
jgi:hypothetical protein